MNKLTNILSKIKPSKAAIVIVMLVVVLTNLFEAEWKEDRRIIAWDVASYYSYLPAVFIYNDLHFQYAIDNKDYFKHIVFIPEGPQGNVVQVVTYGLSVLYAPFFLMGHLSAVIIGADADGYTAPYKFWLLVSSMFYLWLGLFFTRKILIRYFDELSVSLTLLAIGLGTNLFFYTTREAPMSHVYSFALIAVFIFVLIKWLENQRYFYIIILGLVLGVLSLIRPTNIIIVLFFVLWGVSGKQDLTARYKMLFKNSLQILTAVLMFFLIWTPQFIYWKLMAGTWLYYSYGEQSFFFNNPQVLSSLFSYRSGLFLYFPLLLLSLSGLPILFKRKNAGAWPTTVFIVLNIYILSSWCFWWFGGSYGPRAYIDSYAVMAFPMAASIGWLLTKRKWVKGLSVVIVFLLIGHSLFQTQQYRNGAIHYIANSRAAYWDSFGHFEPSDKFYHKLLWPDYEKAQQGIYESLTHYEFFPERFISRFIADVEHDQFIIWTSSIIRNDRVWYLEMSRRARKQDISLDTLIHQKAEWFWNWKLDNPDSPTLELE